MPRTLNRLVDTELKKKSIEPGYHADGGGLYLQVAGASRSRSWIFRFTLHKRSREMGLGSYPELTLQAARVAADKCRQMVAAKTDPIEDRKERQTLADAEAAKSKTFDQCAAEYIAIHEPGWKNAKHREQWTNSLKTYASPVMGHLPVQRIDTNHVSEVIEPLWAAKKVETGSRVRGRIEMILDWAKVRGYRTGDNPARWRGHLSLTLPKRSKVRRVRHQPALPYPEIPAFMKDLRAMEGTSARALEFTILCAARTSAVIGASRNEFDLVAKLWTVQPERTGAKITEEESTPRRVPLSDPAMAILRALPQDKNYMFTGRYPGTGLSDMAMLEMLRDLRPGYTVHGFRSTFKDWASDTTAFQDEVSEAALWHVVEDKTKAAYARSDLLEKRRQLMTAWANYCLRDIAAAANVVPITGRTITPRG